MEESVAESVMQHVKDALEYDGAADVKVSANKSWNIAEGKFGNDKVTIRLNSGASFGSVRLDVASSGSDVELAETENDIKDAINQDGKKQIMVSANGGNICIMQSLEVDEDVKERPCFDSFMSAFEYIFNFSSENKGKVINHGGSDPYGYDIKGSDKENTEEAGKAEETEANKTPEENQETEKPENNKPIKEAKPKVIPDIKPEKTEKAAEKKAPVKKESAPQNRYADNAEKKPSNAGEKPRRKDNIKRGGQKDVEKPVMPVSNEYINAETKDVENDLDSLLADLGMSDEEPSSEKDYYDLSDEDVSHFSAPESSESKDTLKTNDDTDVSDEINHEKILMYNTIDEIFADKRKMADEREDNLNKFSDRLKRREKSLERRISEFESEKSGQMKEAKAQAAKIINSAKKKEESAALKEKAADLRIKQAKEKESITARGMKDLQEQREILESEKKYCIEKEEAQKIVDENEELKDKIEEKDDIISSLRAGKESRIMPSKEEKYRQTISLLMEEKKKLTAENKMLKSRAPVPDRKTQEALDAAREEISKLKAQAPSDAVTEYDVKDIVKQLEISIRQENTAVQEGQHVYVAQTDTNILIAVNTTVRVIYAKIDTADTDRLSGVLKELNSGDLRVSYAPIEGAIVAKYAYTDRDSLANGLTEVLRELEGMQ